MATKFGVKPNNGSDGTNKYSNQCIWLCILEYLFFVLQIIITLTQIRQIALSDGNTVINGEKEEFDTDLHIQALIIVAKKFNLRIYLYISRYDASQNIIISDEPNWIIGESSSHNIVSIVSYGAHFELITSIGERKLYGNKINENAQFIPNVNLAVGKKINYVDDKIVMNQIDQLLNNSSTTERFVAYSTHEMESTQLMIEDLQNELLKCNNNVNVVDVNFNNAIKESLQDRILYLTEIIEKLKKMISDAHNELCDIKAMIKILIE